MPQHYTIEDMQQYASEQGGKCLSKEYWDEVTKLKWMCSKGHTWLAAYNVVSRGAWCPACAIEQEKEEKEKKRREKCLEELKKIATGRGGKLLLDNYQNAHIKLLWECAYGHQWSATSSKIKNDKSWCPYCAGKYKTIIDMQELAARHGGKCLSEKYIDTVTKLEWQCCEGHTWSASPVSILKSTWCQVCRFNQIQEKNKLLCQEIAIKKGGKLLSDRFIDFHEKLLWECSKGHQWEANALIIIYAESWCPYCFGLYKTIKDMHEVAAQRGGKCLSKKYVNAHTLLEWQCSEGHVWKAKPNTILGNNSWCKKCASKIHGEKLKNSIEKYQKIALARGGKLLSEKYIDNKTKLLWECSRGHQWEASPGSISNKTWCRICGYESSATKRKDNIEIYQKIASERGGKLISNEYIGIDEKLLWECAKGHQWYATGSSVKLRKSWCPYCAGKHKTIKDMQKLAAKRGGKCLSKKYINNLTKLEWQCSEGHKWKSAPANINTGSWCHVCGMTSSKERQKNNIEEFRQIAIARGGKLLSDKYINNKTKLLWECKNGHQWETSPSHIKNSNSWCPQCKNKHTTINDMQELVADRGGKCLSEKYTNSSTKLEWQCSEGHIWKSTPNNIKYYWCPVCANNAKKNNIEEYRKIAVERGGRLLTDTYINNKTPLLWECKQGHQWKTSGSNIKNNKTWCPYCIGQKKPLPH